MLKIGRGGASEGLPWSARARPARHRLLRIRDARNLCLQEPGSSPASAAPVMCCHRKEAWNEYLARPNRQARHEEAALCCGSRRLAPLHRLAAGGFISSLLPVLASVLNRQICHKRFGVNCVVPLFFSPYFESSLLSKTQTVRSRRALNETLSRAHVRDRPSVDSVGNRLRDRKRVPFHFQAGSDWTASEYRSNYHTPVIGFNLRRAQLLNWSAGMSETKPVV